ncbi:unnamed protein product [Trichobilharzia szidati]|nr:unnamed protein product [Trichobilharzia szidati]
MDDLQNVVAAMATKLSVHNSKPPPTSGSNTEAVTVRCRHVIKQIPRQYVIAYILSLAQKQCLNLEKESFSFLSYVPEVWTSLLDIIRSMNTDNYDFGYIQTITMETLKNAIKLCCTSLDKTLCKSFYSRASLNSLNLMLDTHSIVNRRRRQEDRWFAVADLLSYVPLSKSSIDQSYLTQYSPITAFGIFDGHNGPEVAEHCSHLTPYLLSIELQRHLFSDAYSSCTGSSTIKSIPNILSEVFHRLNQSANHGRSRKCWTSGTTATVCLFAGDTICTAWVGDSQAWLVFPCTNNNTNTNSNTNSNAEKLPPNINCCYTRNGMQNSNNHNNNNDISNNNNIKTHHTGSFHEPDRMTVLMEIPSPPEKNIDGAVTNSNDNNKNNVNSNNKRVVKSTSLNIMTDRLSLCNGGGNLPTSQSSPIIERHHRQSINHQSSPPTAPVMNKKQSLENKSAIIVDQENSEHYLNIEMNEQLGTPLTDCIHRPESPTEFVSVLRTGGSISTEVGAENSSSVENEIFFSRTPKDSLANLAAARAGVKDAISPGSYCHSQRVSIPPLDNPALLDCRVGCLSSVSRSIGDDETAVGLNALPSMTIWSASSQRLPHDNNHSSSKQLPLCLVAASDGLWDAPGCSGPEISLLANHWYKEHIKPKKECSNYRSFSEFLVNLAVQNGASDNITCLVIWLHAWKPHELKGWSVDSLPTTTRTTGSQIRWPTHSRVTSLVNLNSPSDVHLRGPRDCARSQRASRLKRSSSVDDGYAADLLTPRYSSPPRDVIYQPNC